jgi:hypothetical protein
VAVVVAAAAPAVAEVVLSASSGAPGDRVVARGTASADSRSCRGVEVRFGATQHSDGHVVALGEQVAEGRCDSAAGTPCGS